MLVSVFPVRVPEGFVPLEVGTVNASGKPCPCQESPHAARWGGGFTAPRGPKRLKHHAVDIMGPIGAEIVAPCAGTVQDVLETPKGGHCLYLRSEDGHVFYFAHLHSKPVVEKGDSVEAGQLLGLLGRTGNATRTRRNGSKYGCAHAHISLTSPRGRKIDPVPFFRGLPGAPRGPGPK